MPLKETNEEVTCGQTSRMENIFEEEDMSIEKGQVELVVAKAAVLLPKKLDRYAAA